MNEGPTSQQDGSVGSVCDGAAAAAAALEAAELVKEEDRNAFQQRQSFYRSIITDLKSAAAAAETSANRAASANSAHQTALDTLEYTLKNEHDRKMDEKSRECLTLREKCSDLLRRNKELEHELQQESSRLKKAATENEKLERECKGSREKIKKNKEVISLIAIMKEAVSAAEATKAKAQRVLNESLQPQPQRGGSSKTSRKLTPDASKIPPPPPPVQPNTYDHKAAAAAGSAAAGSKERPTVASSESADLASPSTSTSSSSSSSSSSEGAGAAGADWSHHGSRSPKARGKGGLSLKKKDTSSRDRKRFTVKDAGAKNSVTTVSTPLAASVPTSVAPPAGGAGANGIFRTPSAPSSVKGHHTSTFTSTNVPSSAASNTNAIFVPPRGGVEDTRGMRGRRGGHGATKSAYCETPDLEDSQLVTGSSSPPVDSRRRSRGRGRAKRQKNTPTSSAEKEFSPISPSSHSGAVANSHNTVPIPISFSVADDDGGGSKSASTSHANSHSTRTDSSNHTTADAKPLLKAYQDHFAGTSQTEHQHSPKVSPDNKRKVDVDEASYNNDDYDEGSKYDNYASSVEDGMGMETMNALHGTSMQMSNSSYEEDGANSESSQEHEEHEEHKADARADVGSGPTPHRAGGAGGFKYQEVVRNKADRKKMLPVDCVNCKSFFRSDASEKNMSVEEYMRKYNHSRHRCTAQAPTPEDLSYWEMGFPSTQDDPQQAHIKETGGTKWRADGPRKGAAAPGSHKASSVKSRSSNAVPSTASSTDAAAAQLLRRTSSSRPLSAVPSDRPESKGKTGDGVDGVDMAAVAGDFASSASGSFPSSGRKARPSGWITPKTGFCSDSPTASSGVNRLRTGAGGRSTTPSKRRSPSTAAASTADNAGTAVGVDGGVGDRAAQRKRAADFNNAYGIKLAAGSSAVKEPDDANSKYRASTDGVEERNPDIRKADAAFGNFSAALESAALEDEEGAVEDEDAGAEDTNDAEGSPKAFMFGSAPPEETQCSESSQNMFAGTESLQKQHSGTYMDNTFQTL